MGSFTKDTDTLFHVINTLENTRIGTESPFYKDKDTAGIPHAGTNKEIEGWKWGQRIWPTEEEILSTAVAPTLWNSDTSALAERFWQSGIGDGNDLLLIKIKDILPSGLPVLWSPILNHGHYYIYDQEWYLYSDWYKTEYFQLTSTISGQQYLDLTYSPRPAIPILARQYQFNRDEGRYVVYKDFRKKVAFTTSGTNEFKLDTDFVPPRVWLDSTYEQVIGGDIVLVSGIANSADVLALEKLGVSTGEDYQEFFTEFSPIDRSQTVDVWTYSDSTMPTQWTVISGINSFTSSGQQALVNYELGAVLFGNYDSLNGIGAGQVPTIGHTVSVRYTSGTEITYEPANFSRDYITANDADVNPLSNVKNKGFIEVTSYANDPASIELSALLTHTPPNLYSIDMGNQSGEVIATVKDANGLEIEGIRVNFELLSPTSGDFGGGLTTASSITGSTGAARIFYSSPTNVSDMGGATDTITISGTTTTLNVGGVGVPSSVSGLYTYRIHKRDPILGIPQSEVSTHYTDFFSGEFITTGTQATQTYEETRRTAGGLSKPLGYSLTDVRTGAKTILLTSRLIINPSSGIVESGLAPLYPSSFENVGTTDVPTLKLTYGTVLTDPAGINTDTKGYLVVGESRTSIRAYVINERTGQRIDSNIILLDIKIPQSMNGTFFADTLNSIPSGLMLTTRDVDLVETDSRGVTEAFKVSVSGQLSEEYALEKLQNEAYLDWFDRAKRGSTSILGLVSITASGAPGEIPLGFRLKSPGITVASVLDAVTYIDPNSTVTSGYFNVSYSGITTLRS